MSSATLRRTVLALRLCIVELRGNGPRFEQPEATPEREGPGVGVRSALRAPL